MPHALRALQVLSVLAGALVAVVGLPGPQAAAGVPDRLYSMEEHYEPGDTVTMIGYTRRSTSLQSTDFPDMDVLDWTDTGPFHAYLRTECSEAACVWPSTHPVHGSPGVLPTDLDLGEVEAEATPGHPDGSHAVRVNVTFQLPADMPWTDRIWHSYEVMVTDPTGTYFLGHLAASPVYVGIGPWDSWESVIRDWPLDEPAIADLDDDALLWNVGSSGTSTAAEIRSGAASAPPSTVPDLRGDHRDDLVAGDDPGDGSGALDGAVLPLLGLAALLGLGCAVWRLGAGRKRVRSPGSGHDGHDAPGVPSRQPVRFRL